MNITEFIIDTTAPTAPTEVIAVPTPSNDTTPDYTFNINKAGTITYGGDCSSATTAATVGDNPVTFNTLSAGTHSNCTIKVTDAAGNESPVLNITEFIIDTTAPVITMNGTDVSIELGTAYSDAGATASDNIDGDITANIVTVNNVNVDAVGSYTVTYNVKDAAGNAATQVTRTVNVTAAPADNWYTISPDGNTYTVGKSSVTVDANSFNITDSNNSVVFEDSAQGIYIELKSDGTIVTRYNGKLTASSSFAPGTKVSIDGDKLVIETPIISNITLGGL